jgi:hypothetical protein
MMRRDIACDRTLVALTFPDFTVFKFEPIRLAFN